MKNLKLKKKMNLRSFTLVGIFAIAIIAVSCDKNDDEFYPESASENANLKSGKAIKKRGS